MNGDLIRQAQAIGSRPSSTEDVVVDQPMNNDEAAVFLRISPKTLPTWRLKGRSPPYRKLGSRVVYLRSDLEEFIASLAVRGR